MQIETIYIELLDCDELKRDYEMKNLKFYNYIALNYLKLYHTRNIFKNQFQLK